MDLIDNSPSIEEIITEDGILCSILSSLTLREAVRTSVLSRRWRYIWNHLPKLIFDAANMFESHTVDLIYGKDTPLSNEEKIELMEGKTDQFIRSVNSVLSQLQGPSRVDEFVVRYFLKKVHSDHLGAWADFAISSKTKVLSLHLRDPFYGHFEGSNYDFPCHLLRSTSSVEQLILDSCSLKPPCNINGLNHLKKLELYRVDVTEEDITRLLSNCYTLEHLNLCMIPTLVALSIPHPQDQFQALLVYKCEQLRGKIKINAINFKHLGYNGYPVDFIFRESSQLLYAFITFQTEVGEPNLDFYINKLSSNLTLLRILSCTIVGNSMVPDFRSGTNSFIHLRHLRWCWNVSVKMSILHLSTLLDATPFLDELTLRLRAPCKIEAVPKRLGKLRKTLPERPHTHLKTLEFLDFCWDKGHVELMLYILKNAIELETVKILNGRRGVDETTLRKLRQEVPAKVKLVIMNYNTEAQSVDAVDYLSEKQGTKF